MPPEFWSGFWIALGAVGGIAWALLGAVVLAVILTFIVGVIRFWRPWR